MESDPRQLVGKLCVRCGKPINSIFDAVFCERCSCPVHHRCMTAGAAGSSACILCGAEPTSQTTHQQQLRESVARRPTGEQRAEKKPMRLAAVACVLLVLAAWAGLRAYYRYFEFPIWPGTTFCSETLSDVKPDLLQTFRDMEQVWPGTGSLFLTKYDEMRQTVLLYFVLFTLLSLLFVAFSAAAGFAIWRSFAGGGKQKGNATGPLESL